MNDKIKKACEYLSQEARELYLSDHIPVLDAVTIPINSLEFYRNYVSRNIPVLIKNSINDWPAVKKWSSQYFREVLANKIVNVAVTPNGYADAIATDGHGNEYFTLPEERDMPMSLFLDNLDNYYKSEENSNEIFYIQQQNSNFEQFYHELWPDICNLSWADEAFGQNSDAVNFWMGDIRAVTSMHKDPYENIYAVISGEKYFTLHPPTDLPWIQYKKYSSARYKKLNDNDEWIIEPIIEKPSEHSPELDDSKGDNGIPWICIDPLNPNYEKYPEYKNVTTIKVTVEAGDILYLPSLWFHHVQQSHACIAVNFWYDMDYNIKYAYYNFVENLCK